MPSTSKKTGAAKAAPKSAKRASKPKSTPKKGGAKASVAKQAPAKPAVKAAIPAPPFSTASFTMYGSTLRGTAEISRSTSPGTSASFVKFVKPRFSISSISFSSTCTE